VTQPNPTSAAAPLFLPQSEIVFETMADSSKLLHPPFARRQPMQGFDDKFVDIVDYIIRITHEIWEEKAIGRIYNYYSHNCPIHTAGGLIYGRDEAVAGTAATLAAYPDRRLFAEDVIWTGDDQVGFYTSHRIMHVGVNTGPSQYGPAHRAPGGAPRYCTLFC
jgi:hypothetical protein